MIRVRLTHQLPGFALQAEFDAPSRGVTAIHGPSGSGKTTLLRCIAGLERARTARIEVGDALWQDEAPQRPGGRFVPTHQRGVGYVFQEASLFGHLDVRGNLNYGLQRSARAAGGLSWERVVTLLGLEPLLARRPQHLSGGERQRVAIGRALLAAPCLLLMDEPLSAVDAPRRSELLPWIEQVQRELAIPILYVSHQMDEIAQLADHLVRLDGGRVAASGALEDVLARLDLPMARDEDAGVVVPARVAAHDARHHLSELAFAGGRLFLPDPAPGIGAAVRVRIRARDVSLAATDHLDSSILNRIPVRVAELAGDAHPAYVLLRLDAQGTALLARITLRSCEQLRLAVGSPVWAQVKSVALVPDTAT